MVSVTASAQAVVGEKIKVDNLYYCITSLTPATVEVAPQNDVAPYWNEADKPTGDLVIPATLTHDGMEYTVNSIGGNAFRACESLTAVTIPNSVETIGSQAFRDCKGLTAFSIPNSVETIGMRAFFSCKQLTTVSIPASVTTIGETPFSWCTNLTTITVDKANTAYCSQDGILFNKDMTTIVRYPPAKADTAYTIPASVITIRNSAFNEAKLTAVTIPNSVETIEEYAFNACRALTVINIPNSVETIELGAFNNCQKLTAINSQIVDPATVTLGNNVFRRIPKGTDDNACTLYVPDGSKLDYQEAAQWKDFAPNIKEDTFTGLENNLTEQGVTVRGGKGEIYIYISVGASRNLSELSVDVYNLSGALVYSVETSRTLFLQIPIDTGVYVVHTSNGTEKVIVW